MKLLIILVCCIFINNFFAKEVKATKVEKITLDGKLNEKEWATAQKVETIYFDRFEKRENFAPLMLDNIDKDAFEKAYVSVLYDDNAIYIGARLEDSDIVARGEEDQLHHYLKGDTFEIFLKGKDSYFECYSTPSGKKTSLLIESPGYMGISTYPVPVKMETAVSINGTLNNPKDKDNYWETEVKIPWTEVKKYIGDGPYTMMFGRYNYNFNFRTYQLSSFPKMPLNGFHIVEYYAKLIIDNK